MNLRTIVLLSLLLSMSACSSAADGDCGDGVCEVGEHTACPADCANIGCGDGVCAVTESVGTCAIDCYCGNGSCDDGESSLVCATDCLDTDCGDGVCEVGETPTSCQVDCPSNCTHPVCDIVPNCGCSGGETCTLGTAIEEPICVITGPMGVADPCTSQLDCGFGMYCVENLYGVAPVCYRWCLEDSDCAPSGPGAVCATSMVGVPPGTPKLCSFACDPMDNTGCPADTGCEITGSPTEAAATRCTGPRENGTAACTDTLQCQGPLICDSIDNRCTSYCRRSEGDADCNPGDTCYQLNGDATIDGVEYGICAL